MSDRKYLTDVDTLNIHWTTSLIKIISEKSLSNQEEVNDTDVISFTLSRAAHS